MNPAMKIKSLESLIASSNHGFDDAGTLPNWVPRFTGMIFVRSFS